MRARQSLLACCLAFSSLATAQAQTAPDASGRWEGIAASAIGMQGITLDLARNPDGTLKGALSNDTLHGLPLASVSQSGDTVRWALSPQLGVSFEGHLGEGGKTLSGLVDTPQGEASLTLARAGEAQLPKPPASTAIDARLVGTWDGAVDVEGRHLRVRLVLAQAGGGATATMASPDEGLEIQAGVTQTQDTVKLDVPAVEAVYEARLNAAGDELSGTFAQRGMDIPLTLRKAR